MRTDDLRAELDRGHQWLARYDWVVVHEGAGRHPMLERLRLMQRIRPDRSFGGNNRFDFTIDAVPPVFGRGPAR